METESHMENLHTQPDQPEETPKEPTLSRRQRRELERMEKNRAEEDRQYTAKHVNELRQNLETLLKVYVEGYNDFAKSNPGNSRGLLGISIPWTVNITTVPVEDLATSDEDLKNYQACMGKEYPGHINVMYLRLDMQFHLTGDTEVTARPGVPETIEENADGTKNHTQLFYHAVYPIPDHEKHTQNTAVEKLLSDVLVHMFCMGIDMQQVNNNKQWQRRLNQQTAVMKEKLDEVNEIFSHVGKQEEAPMQVNK